MITIFEMFIQNVAYGLRCSIELSLSDIQNHKALAVYSRTLTYMKNLYIHRCSNLVSRLSAEHTISYCTNSDSKFHPLLSIRCLANISVCMMTFAMTMDIHQSLQSRDENQIYTNINWIIYISVGNRDLEYNWSNELIWNESISL